MTNNNILKQFNDLIKKRPVFLDTETTGLGPDAQVCEIAVVALDGSVLLDSLVKPTVPIPPGAEAIHHISNEMVSGSPSFYDLMLDLGEALGGSHLCIYNAEYDMRVMRQSAEVNKFRFVDFLRGRTRSVDDRDCIMKLYAEYWGAWSDYHQSYTFQSLSEAVKKQVVNLPEGLVLHRALADAELTRLLTIELGERYEIPF